MKSIKELGTKIYEINISFNLNDYTIKTIVNPYNGQDIIHSYTITQLSKQDLIYDMIFHYYEINNDVINFTIYVNRYSTSLYNEAYQNKKEYMNKIKEAIEGKIEFPGAESYSNIVTNINNKLDNIINNKLSKDIEKIFKKAIYDIINNLYITKPDETDAYYNDYQNENNLYDFLKNKKFIDITNIIKSLEKE